MRSMFFKYHGDALHESLGRVGCYQLLFNHSMIKLSIYLRRIAQTHQEWVNALGFAGMDDVIKRCEIMGVEMLPEDVSAFKQVFKQLKAAEKEAAIESVAETPSVPEKKRKRPAGEQVVAEEPSAD